MNLQLQSKSKVQNSKISVSGSKSETNRLLLLQALFPEIEIKNASNSDDSTVMTEALAIAKSQEPIAKSQEPKAKSQEPRAESQELKAKNQKLKAKIDVHHAGTAMRFLTAFFAVQDGKEVVLTGSSRMQERPIKILVEALRNLGAEIHYEKNEGFPPLKIIGKKLKNNTVSLPADVSSQYISALLLIAPKLENGLKITLTGKITSVPYIKMTLALLNEIGAETSFENNSITVSPLAASRSSILTVESDWSSASYWYSIIALSEIGTAVSLSSFKENSLQGDSALIEIYKNFGVKTVFTADNSITISKENDFLLSAFDFRLDECPDIAQTIAVTCFGLGVGCHLSGLHTLKIKETDRLSALKNELTKLGAAVHITDDSLTLEQSEKINENITIKTYQDHRMAMAFAPLALKTPICIEDAEVVSKSYPNFWNDLKIAGFVMMKVD